MLISWTTGIRRIKRTKLFYVFLLFDYKHCNSRLCVIVNFICRLVSETRHLTKFYPGCVHAGDSGGDCHSNQQIQESRPTPLPRVVDPPHSCLEGKARWEEEDGIPGAWHLQALTSFLPALRLELKCTLPVFSVQIFGLKLHQGLFWVSNPPGYLCNFFRNTPIQLLWPFLNQIVYFLISSYASSSHIFILTLYQIYDFRVSYPFQEVVFLFCWRFSWLWRSF